MKGHDWFFPPRRVIKVSLTSERNTIITLHSSVILCSTIESLSFSREERASVTGLVLEAQALPFDALV